MKLKTTLFLLLSATSLSSFAIKESEVSSRFMSELVPSMKQRFQQDHFTGVDQIKINYYFSKKQNPNGVIIISTGQSEASLKWAEFLYDTKDINYDIYMIDHRGQGESGRILTSPQDFSKCHVHQFTDYVEDFTYFVKNIVQPEKYKKSFLLGHSMGGAIASGFLLENPRDVTAVILTAPMLEINTEINKDLGLIQVDVSLPNRVASLITSAAQNFHAATDFGIGQKPYNPKPEFENNKSTSSLARYLFRKDLYNSNRNLQIGGPTYNWQLEAYKYADILRNTRNLYQVPTLILQPGADTVVRGSGQDIACANSPDYCRIIRKGFEKSRHDILTETDSIRTPALNAILAYIRYFESH